MTNYAGHPDQNFGCYTYSQHGEDLVIINLLKMMGFGDFPKTEPLWLDIGAHHPVNISNTKLLSDRGYIGVNVEANPNLIEAFKLDRPNDINVNFGIGTEESFKTFYMYDNHSGRNTFSASESVSLEPYMKITSKVELPVITIREVLRLYTKGKYPPLLSIDIEGLDFDVLSSCEFTPENSPNIICVECRKETTSNMLQMLGSKGFMFYCRMGENLILVHESRMSVCI